MFELVPFTTVAAWVKRLQRIMDSPALPCVNQPILFRYHLAGVIGLLGGELRSHAKKHGENAEPMLISDISSYVTDRAKVAMGKALETAVPGKVDELKVLLGLMPVPRSQKDVRVLN